MASKKKAVAKAETFTQEQSQAVVKKVGQWTPQSVTQKVTDAQLTISKTLGDVSAQLQNTLKEFDEANQAVELKKQELETIYEKEQVLKDIDTLHADHANTKANLENDFSVFQATLENQKREKEIEHEKEENDFQFNLQQARQQEEQKFQDELRFKKNAQRDQDENREKVFLARQEALQKQENELIDLRKQVAEFPVKLDAEVKKAEAIVGSTVKRDWEHKLQLLQKDFDTQRTVFQNNENTLKAQLANQDGVITQLTARVASSEEKVSTIATKALEAASSTKSLADVQNLLQNQNNGQQARKA